MQPTVKPTEKQVCQFCHGKGKIVVKGKEVVCKCQKAPWPDKPRESK